ncbi:MAG: hypothetical protein ACAI44_29870, partial [Candidatus Sericytochromatia bacterium]
VNQVVVTSLAQAAPRAAARGAAWLALRNRCSDELLGVWAHLRQKLLTRLPQAQIHWLRGFKRRVFG